MHKTEEQYKQEPLRQISMQQGQWDGAEESAAYQHTFFRCVRI